jgi:phosphoserine phosphatase RsbU/P
MPDAAPAGGEVAELLAFARAAQSLLDGGEVLEALLGHGLAVAGAARGAVLERTALDGLALVRDRGSGLPAALAVGDVRAPLWGVLLGRTRLAWDGPAQVPAPFADVPGWGEGLVVRVATRRSPTKLLALAGPGVAAADGAIVQGLADVAAPTIEGLELAGAMRRSQALLRGVTQLAGDLGAAVSPDQLLEATTAGLSALDGIGGARVWAAADAHDPTPQVVAGAAHGDLPPTRAVEARVRRLLDPATGRGVRALVERPARSSPGGPFVTLLTLPTAPPRVLGILHHRPLDDLSQHVLASLATAIGPAMREVEVVAERRSLLSGYASALRPSARPQGLELAVEHHPNTTAPGSFGGDFYDWFDVADDHAVIALGDVSGKGISAASAASMVVWSLRAIGGRGAQPTVISHLLNGVVAQELDADRFVTLALMTVDRATWEARLLLSGHPAPLRVTAEGAAPVDCAIAPPLGVSAVTSGAPPATVPLAPGDALVLFTDGVTDAASAIGVRYGVDRLAARAAALAAAPGWSAASLAAGLWEAVRSWAGGPPDDDCAILVARRPPT